MYLLISIAFISLYSIVQQTLKVVYSSDTKNLFCKPAMSQTRSCLYYLQQKVEL